MRSFTLTLIFTLCLGFTLLKPTVIALGLLGVIGICWFLLMGITVPKEI